MTIDSARDGERERSEGYGRKNRREQEEVLIQVRESGASVSGGSYPQVHEERSLFSGFGHRSTDLPRGRPRMILPPRYPVDLITRALAPQSLVVS